MLLLNIADIHFRHPLCATNMDEDAAYRKELVHDVKHMVRNLEMPVSAILVVGDIAYAGKPEEYVCAYNWLMELAGASNCPPEMIFVVPGNHDVDRGLSKDLSVETVQGAIRTTPLSGRKNKLLDFFLHAELGKDLFKPLEAYNAFSGRFNCDLRSPDRLFWQTGYKDFNPDLDLGDGFRLRLFGLNSTLLSGHKGGNDQRMQLYLSPLQTVLETEENIVNAIICHHPPDWLEDIDEVEDMICRGAPLQFFGHKHRQRIHRDYNFIRFSAGAVNPDKNEGAWQPGYNLIELKVVNSEKRRYLEVKAHVRQWQDPFCFAPKKQSVLDNEEVFTHRLPIKWSEHDPPVTASKAEPELMAAIKTERISEASKSTMSQTNPRKLIWRFWELQSSERKKICQDLNLISEDDFALTESERYRQAIIQASKLGKMEELDESIKKVEQRSNGNK